jgi:Fe2+ or Zn2+ uptake regulation protein
MNDWNCQLCGDTGELPDGQICAECCPHDEHDHGYCLDCHKDILDDLVGEAELLRDE